jgi:serine/threonine protein kinase
MAKNPIEQRTQRYFRFSSQIAQMDNARLRSLVGASESRGGWGWNHSIDLGSAKVFVKRIPVTDLEYNNLLSTKNLFHLPTYYNYGVGSAGLGVFRELVAHIKTTNWVLDGRIETFPLMYHYRILPFAGERKEVDRERHQYYVESWGGDENIGRYMLDRASANHELLLFLEFIPQVLHTWLQANLGKVDSTLDELCATIDFLRKNGIIHFDAHFHNVVTDGERPYLTDFGLVLDRSFALTEDEAAFFRANTHYDYGMILGCLGGLVHSTYEALPKSDQHRIAERYGMTEVVDGYKRMSIFLDHIEEIHADGVLKLDPRAVTSVVRYRSIIALMQDFLVDMSRNNKKDTKFRHAQLKRLLKEAKVGAIASDVPNG